MCSSDLSSALHLQAQPHLREAEEVRLHLQSEREVPPVLWELAHLGVPYLDHALGICDGQAVEGAGWIETIESERRAARARPPAHLC